MYKPLHLSMRCNLGNHLHLFPSRGMSWLSLGTPFLSWVLSSTQQHLALKRVGKCVLSWVWNYPFSSTETTSVYGGCWMRTGGNDILWACLSQVNIANYCLDYQSYRIGSPWFSASGNTGIRIVQQNFGIGIWLVISTSKLFSLKSSSKFIFKGSLKNTQLKVKRLAGDSNF